MKEKATDPGAGNGSRRDQPRRVTREMINAAGRAARKAEDEARKSRLKGKPGRRLQRHPLTGKASLAPPVPGPDPELDPERSVEPAPRTAGHPVELLAVMGDDLTVVNAIPRCGVPLLTPRAKR